MNNLAAAINEIAASEVVGNPTFPSIYLEGEFDLYGFDEQSSDYDFCDVEYINQCRDYGDAYHGTIAVPFDGYLIVFNFYEQD